MIQIRFWAARGNMTRILITMRRAIAIWMMSIMKTSLRLRTRILKICNRGEKVGGGAVDFSNSKFLNAVKY